MKPIAVAATNIAALGTAQIVAQMEPVWRALQDAGFGFGAHVLMDLTGLVSLAAVVISASQGKDK